MLISVDCVKKDNIYNLRKIQIGVVKLKTDQDRRQTIINLPHTEDDLCMSSGHTAYLASLQGQRPRNVPDQMFLFQSGTNQSGGGTPEDDGQIRARTKFQVITSV